MIFLKPNISFYFTYVLPESTLPPESQLWICQDVWVFLPFLQLSQTTCVYVPHQLNLTMKVKVKVTQSCPTLCIPTDYTVHGILQARILEWVAFPFSRRSSQPRDRNLVSCIACRFFTCWATWEAPTSLWRALINLLTFGRSRMTILMPDIVSGTEETEK